MQSVGHSQLVPKISWFGGRRSVRVSVARCPPQVVSAPSAGRGCGPKDPRPGVAVGYWLANRAPLSYEDCDLHPRCPTASSAWERWFHALVLVTTLEACGQRLGFRGRDLVGGAKESVAFSDTGTAVYWASRSDWSMPP